MKVLVEGSLLALISTQESSILFSLPCPAVEGSDGEALVGAWNAASLQLGAER